MADYDKGIADATEATRIDPTYADAYYNRGIMYERSGRTVDAISDYRRALAMNRSDAASEAALKRLGAAPDD